MLGKVIFLDIDGVLNVIPEDFDEFGALFHKHFEDNLKWIIEETNAKIVISSTWRLAGLQEMKKMWKKRKLAGEVIDVTPLGTMDNIRGDEIQTWLDRNNVKNYVIIDDDVDFLESQLNNFIRTSENSDHFDCVDIGYGLTRKCAEKAIEILNK
jgi:hypothetical protein